VSARPYQHVPADTRSLRDSYVASLRLPRHRSAMDAADLDVTGGQGESDRRRSDLSAAEIYEKQETSAGRALHQLPGKGG
jgi:hypothetical protein